MKRTSIYSILVCLSALLFTGCQENDPIEYKYQDLPQFVECDGADKKLLHEALYSFQMDIGKAYNFRNWDPKEPMYIINGYRTFVYKGGMGEADYPNIVSAHSKKLFERLLEEDLWLDGEGYSHLDYSSEYVSCVIANIKNPDTQATIASLNEINSMGPKLMAEPLRRNIRDVNNDPYLAMYLALDFYYQYLIDADLSNVPDEDEPEELIKDFTK